MAESPLIPRERERVSTRCKSILAASSVRNRRASAVSNKIYLGFETSMLYPGAKTGLTSSHGSNWIEPSLSDAKRRSISSRHSCSASGSISASRLSNNESASAARASSGSSIASWNSCAASRAIAVVYSVVLAVQRFLQLVYRAVQALVRAALLVDL